MELDDHGVECSYSERRHKYEVFLSFRGEDTRKKFTDHLYNALKRDGVMIAFRDEEELERGEAIKPSLVQAIEESFSAIVVLSKNYANSRWCLDELVKILDSKKKLGLHVFPVFYEVDPSDVGHQRGSFAEAIEKHEQRFANDKMRVQRWRDALKEVADFAGWNSQDYRYESEFIDDVVKKVKSKLYGQPPFNSNEEGLVGIDRKIAEFDSFLESTSKEVRFIGIWGMGGLGKTTLARAVYERIKANYDISFFLHNVREKSSTESGLIELQKELLSHPNWRTEIKVGDCYEGRELIERRLCNRKVLLVLDDVSDMRQLENLAKKKGWFGKGSRIIITTRDQRLLSLHDVVSQYHMGLLSHKESLQLLRQIVSNAVAQSVKGLPLAIKVIGSFLCGRSKPEWDEALKKIGLSDEHDHLFNTLKVSFDGLKDNEKDIFLDVACFFNGMAVRYVNQMLENNGLYPKTGIKVLIEKSLVTVYQGRLWVHDTLQEMGQKIVILQSPDDAGGRSRIWSLEDAYQVLGNNRGIKKVHGIVVRFDKQYVMDMDPDTFSSMSNLKLLIISHFSHGELNLDSLKCLSNALKVIVWEGYPLKVLPSRPRLNELVELRMHQSKLEQLWTGTHFLPCLKFIDLSHSKNLIRTPNFDETPNLQMLILQGCISLVEVHHSLGQHRNLVIVHFEGCNSIKTLPTKLEMNSLKKFDLSGCSQVENLPEFGEVMERLSELLLPGTAISKLPQSLVNLTGLALLDLRNCKKLGSLPSGFPKFSRLRENLNENEALEVHNVGGTAIVEVLSSLNNLKQLCLGGCEDLISSSIRFLWCPPFSDLSSLVFLDLSACNLDDESLPSEFNNLTSLTALDLRGNNFVELPSGLISKLRKLEFVAFDGCPRLRCLPQLPSNLSIILASDCPLLEDYVCPQQLREFIQRFDCHQPRVWRTRILDNGFKLHFLCHSTNVSGVGTYDSEVSEFYMQPTRILTICGRKVPSWFHNQSYFCAEDFPYDPTNVSLEAVIPESCGSSEYWGISVCLLLKNDMKPAIFDKHQIILRWNYRVSNGEYSDSQRFCIINMQERCSHQLCIMYIRFSSFVVKQSLRLVFFIRPRSLQKRPISEIVECGWRVLSKEEVEGWQK